MCLNCCRIWRVKFTQTSLWIVVLCCHHRICMGAPLRCHNKTWLTCIGATTEPWQPAMLSPHNLKDMFYCRTEPGWPALVSPQNTENLLGNHHRSWLTCSGFTTELGGPAFGVITEPDWHALLSPRNLDNMLWCHHWNAEDLHWCHHVTWTTCSGVTTKPDGPALVSSIT